VSQEFEATAERKFRTLGPRAMARRFCKRKAPVAAGAEFEDNFGTVLTLTDSRDAQDTKKTRPGK
jgi:hypothetical protein